MFNVVTRPRPAFEIPSQLSNTYLRSIFRPLNRGEPHILLLNPPHLAHTSSSSGPSGLYGLPAAVKAEQFKRILGAWDQVRWVTTLEFTPRDSGRNIERSRNQYSDQYGTKLDELIKFPSKDELPGNEHTKRWRPMGVEGTSTSGTPFWLAEGAKEPIEVLYHRMQQSAAKGHIRRGQMESVEEYAEFLIKERGEMPNQALYSNLILGNVGIQGSARMVWSLLEEMRDEGIEADEDVCRNILKALAAHPDYVLQTSVLDHMQHSWHSLTDDDQHYITAGLLRTGQYELALERFDHMHSYNIPVQEWLYDKAVYMLGNAGALDEMIWLFKQRNNANIRSTNVSAAVWSWVLDTCSSNLHYDGALYVWMRRVRYQYINPSSGTCLNVLHCAARKGDIELATDVFRVLTNRDTEFDHEHYELLIEAYLNASPPDLKTALSILCIMNESGVVPHASSTRAIVSHLKTKSSLPALGFDFLLKLSKEGHQSQKQQLPCSAMNALIEACYAHGDSRYAMRLYKAFAILHVNGPDTETFNLLFRGCAQHGRTELALSLAKDMVQRKIEPNAETYNAMILACLPPTPQVEFDDGNDAPCEISMNYYYEARSHGVRPKQAVLEKLIEAMVEYGDVRVWNILEDMELMKMRTDKVRKIAARARRPSSGLPAGGEART